jgi:hypothetical protein
MTAMNQHTGVSTVRFDATLDTAPVLFPGGHGGFVGDEYGRPGAPEAFASTLREARSISHRLAAASLDAYLQPPESRSMHPFAPRAISIFPKAMMTASSIRTKFAQIDVRGG